MMLAARNSRPTVLGIDSQDLLPLILASRSYIQWPTGLFYATAECLAYLILTTNSLEMLNALLSTRSSPDSHRPAGAIVSWELCTQRLPKWNPVSCDLAQLRTAQIEQRCGDCVQQEFERCDQRAHKIV